MKGDSYKHFTNKMGHLPEKGFLSKVITSNLNESRDLAIAAKNIGLVVMASGTHPQGDPDLCTTQLGGGGNYVN